MSCTITAAEFKEYFDRGQFLYGDSDPYVYPEIRDKDIDQAIAEALAVFNGDLYPDEDTCKQALYYMTAHFLQKDFDAVGEGGAASFVQTSHSADGLSESFAVPEELQTGALSFYGTTYYGIKWWQLTKPYIDGAVFCVAGATTP